MIYLGADHGGFKLKEQIKHWLTEWGIVYEDLGAKTYDINDDYPQYAFNVANKVSQNPQHKGILICRSASGMMIAANKIKGIRAVACFELKQTIYAREHNDANIIGISGDWTDKETARQIIQAFLNTAFSNEERHRRRLEQINEYENRN